MPVIARNLFPRDPDVYTFTDFVADDFKRLSDEIILHIFSYLPQSTLCKCGMTCRRLKALSLDDSLWKRLDLGGKSLTAEQLHRLIQRGVEYLRLSRAQIRDPLPSPVSSIRSHLRYLDLSMVSCVEATVINDILSRCRDLIAVSLENCVIDDQSCTALGKNVGLQLVNLSGAQGFTTTGLESLLRGCRFLEELNVAWTKLTREGVNFLCATAPRSLRRLNLAGCRDEALFDGDIVMLCTVCPNLTELDISDGVEVTGLAIDAIAEFSPKLRVLSCSRCYKVEPYSFTTLPPTLVELNIFNNIQEESWPAFLRMLPESLKVNQHVFSTIARPTVGLRRTSIWGHRVRAE